MKKIILLSMFLCFKAICAEHFLVQATNDEDQEITKLYLVLNDEGEITHLKKSTFIQEELLREDPLFPVKEGENRFLLKKKIKDEEKDENDKSNYYEVLRLVSDDFSKTEGGAVQLEYLYNGAFNSYGRPFQMTLKKVEGEWALLVDGREIEWIHMVSNYSRWLRRTVGISFIKVIQ